MFLSPPDDLEELSARVRDHCSRKDVVPDPSILASQLLRKRELINRLELDFARDAASSSRHTASSSSTTPCLVLAARQLPHDHPSVITSIRVGARAPVLAQSTTALIEGRIGFAHLGLIAETAQAISRSPTATSAMPPTARSSSPARWPTGSGAAWS